MREVKCKHCGQIFTTDDKRKKFCDENCRTAYYNEYRRAHYKEVYERYIENGTEKINAYQRKRRERFKEERYRRIARCIIKICRKEEAERDLVDYLMNTFNGLKKGE